MTGICFNRSGAQAQPDHPQCPRFQVLRTIALRRRAVVAKIPQSTLRSPAAYVVLGVAGVVLALAAGKVVIWPAEKAPQSTSTLQPMPWPQAPTTGARSGNLTPQPPGPIPEGKVWSPNRHSGQRLSNRTFRLPIGLNQRERNRLCQISLAFGNWTQASDGGGRYSIRKAVWINVIKK